MRETDSNINRPRGFQVDEQADEPPRLAGVRLGPALAGLLYALLVGSAALALFGRQFPGRLSPGLSLAAPWVFLLFAVAFAAYRLRLVRAGKYGAFKGFFQIGAALLFFTLLLPSARNRYEEQSEGLTGLLLDGSPEVRQLAAEVARHRPEGLQYAPALVRCLRDPIPQVRQECHRSLVALTGQDLGAPADPAGIRAWEARYP